MPGIRLDEISEVMQPQLVQPQGLFLSDIAEVVPEQAAGHPAARPLPPPREKIGVQNVYEEFNVPTPFTVTKPEAPFTVNLQKEAENAGFFDKPVPKGEYSLRSAGPPSREHERDLEQLPKPGPLERVKGAIFGNVHTDTLPWLGRMAEGKPSDQNLAVLDKAQVPVSRSPAVALSALSPERGPQRAALQVAESLTTPENLAILAIAKLRQIPAAAHRLASGYFSTQMLTSALSDDPELEDAIARGDRTVANEIATRKALEMVMGMGAGTHAVKGDAAPVPRETDRLDPRIPGNRPGEMIVRELAVEDEQAALDRAAAASPQAAQARLAELEAAQLARDRAAGPLPERQPLFQEVQRSPERLPTGLKPPERPIPISEIVAAMEPAPAEAPAAAPPQPVVEVPAPAPKRRGHPAARRGEPVATPAAAPATPEAPPPATTADVTPEKPAAAPLVEGAAGGERGAALPLPASGAESHAITTEVPNAGPSPAAGHPAARRGSSERGAITIPAGAVAAITGRPIPTTPSEVYALENVARREAARTTGAVQGAWNRTKVAIAKLKAQTVDATAPILDAIAGAQREHGFTLRPSERIEGAIDKAYRSASIAEQFAKDHGLVDAIRAVDNLDYFEEYLLAKHTADVRGRGFETGRDAVKDAALAQDFASRVAIPATGNTPAVTYRELGDRIARYSQDLLDYSVDAGTIAPEMADLLKRVYPNYVPIHRVFSEIERGTIPRRPGRAVASLSAQTLVQRLEGSERAIESPLGSLIDHTRLAIRQGEVNKAARMLAGYRDLPGMAGLITEVPESAPTPKHSFSYLEAGRKRMFETTPELAAAAKALDIQSIGVLGKIFAAPARVMKLFTTGVSAPFAFSNVMSDALQTAVTSKYDNSLLSPGAFGRAFLSAFSPHHTHLWDDIVRQGGGFTSFDLFRGEPQQNVSSVRAGRGPAARARYTLEHPVRSVGDLFRAAEDLVGRTEQFGRARLYEMTLEAARKQGMNEADARALAVIESNNRLPNYLRFGSAMRSLNAAIPYLNANIQGSRSLLRAARENPVHTAARLGVALYLPVAATTLWNLSDPERRKAYQDIEPWEKDNNLIWVPPNPTKDKQGRWNVVKVKITPGLSNLSVPLRRGLEQYAGMDPVGTAEIAQALFGAVSPIEASSKGLSTIVPQAIKPTTQAMANYDFFRQRPIVSDRLKDLPPNLQVMPYTSGTARAVGEKLGASPIKTEQFIKDTLGGIAPQILNASDRALAAAGVIPESQVGGTSTAEAVAARFSKARGGEQEHKVYEGLRKVQDAAVSVAVERAKRSLPYLRAADEAARNKILEQVANRERRRVANQLPDNFKTLPVERKARIVERLTHRGHPAALAGVR